MLLNFIVVAFFVLSIAITVRSRLFLPAFFVLCYMLPFLPLFAASMGMDVTFWTGDRFVYPPDSREVSRMQQLWLSSSLGIIFGLVVSRIRVRWSGGAGSQEAVVPHRVAGFLVLGWSRALSIFLASAVLISLRLVAGGEMLGERLSGYELIVCMMLLLCWTLAIHSRGRGYFCVAAFLTAVYAWAQVQTGDRDFFVILIALLLRLGALRARAGAMLAMGAAGLVLMFSGAVISMVRMDVDLSAEGLFEFMAFNSWNATILPVLLMVEAESDSGMLLYGKTYLDMILSVPPSPFFTLAGVEKPIQADNPAFWFFIDGLGGMHMAGVALRNFDLVGVVVQSLFFVLALSALERRLRIKRSPWVTYLYLCIAGVLMHTVWYSLVSMLNGLLFFALLYFAFSIKFSVPVSVHAKGGFRPPRGVE